MTEGQIHWVKKHKRDNLNTGSGNNHWRLKTQFIYESMVCNVRTQRLLDGKRHATPMAGHLPLPVDWCLGMRRGWINQAVVPRGLAVPQPGEASYGLRSRSCKPRQTYDLIGQLQIIITFARLICLRRLKVWRWGVDTSASINKIHMVSRPR
jgi:hypothetical protein